MPKTTPKQKIEGTKEFGWDYIDVVLIWDNFDEALYASKKFEIENSVTFVPPFDDPRIIVWQATIWLEIFDELQDIDYVMSPVWWWWVVSGSISSASVISPNTKIIWVEPAWASSMKESLIAWENITLDRVDTFVDWASVRRVWELNFEIARDYWLEIITCPEGRICSTILDCFKDWIIVEPAWALAIDALKDLWDRIKWKKIVVILSWWNIGLERYGEVKERSMKFEWKKKYFLIELAQRSWSLKEYLESIVWPNDNITIFEYKNKYAFIWMEVDDKNNWLSIEWSMKERWISFEDVTYDDKVLDLLL